MNLYEVTISGTCQQVQASKPEVALNNALRRLKYGDNNIMLNNVLKEQHSIHLDIDIKNVGKMIQIQKIDAKWERQYVLRSEWNKHVYSHDDWVTCKYAKEKELNDQLNRRKYAETIRHILKALHQMGDDAFWDECWKTTDTEILDEWRPRLKQVNETTMETVKDILFIPGFKV